MKRNTVTVGDLRLERRVLEANERRDAARRDAKDAAARLTSYSAAEAERLLSSREAAAEAALAAELDPAQLAREAAATQSFVASAVESVEARTAGWASAFFAALAVGVQAEAEALGVRVADVDPSDLLTTENLATAFAAANANEQPAKLSLFRKRLADALKAGA